MTPPGCTWRVVVAGAGASGVLTAAHLLAQDAKPVHVTLVDRRWWPGRGTAYATTNPLHLLNVPAGSMSAFADRPGHFVEWARRRHAAVTPASFLQRSLYGEYLEAVLTDFARAVPDRLSCRTAEATAVVFSRSGELAVALGGGAHIPADQVIVAIGNLPPLDPPAAARRLASTSRYVRDPWAPRALEGVAGRDPVLLIGTGLTAVDAILSLDAAGQTGLIVAVSRHGLLPREHLEGPPDAPPWPEALRARTCRELLGTVRRRVREEEAQGGDWRSVVDGLRAATPALWQGLPPAEQARFLRHASRYWEVHRHRMAPEVAARVRSLLATGRLVVRAARVESCTPVARGVEVKLSTPCGELLRVAHVVNCTGPSLRVTSGGNPLVDWLVRSGSARPGRWGLGLDVTDDGALVDADGIPSRSLFTIGALRRGHLWETTSIPEIREQAATLARLIAGAREEVPA